MTSNKRILLSGAAALVLGALICARLSLLPGQTYLKRLIEREVSRTVGMEVTVGDRIGVGLVPRAQLSLGNITVNATRPGAVKTIKIQRARIWLALRPLLKREVRIDRAELYGVSLQLVRGPGPGLKKPENYSGKKPLTVGELRIYRGALTYTGSKAEHNVEAGGIELTAKDLYYGNPPGEAEGRKLFFNGEVKCAALRVGSRAEAAGIEAAITDFSYLVPAGGRPGTLFLKGKIKCRDFMAGDKFKAARIEAAAKDLSYTIPAGGKTYKTLSFKGGLSCGTLSIGEKTEASGAGPLEGDIYYVFNRAEKPYKNLSVKADLKITELKAGGLSFSRVEMKAAAGKGVFSASPLQLDFLGGRGNGSLKVDLSSDAPVYAANYTVAGTRLESLLGAFSGGRTAREPLEGPADLSADITARGGGAEALFNSMKGRVSLSGKDLVLHNMDLDAIISKLARSQKFNLLDAGAFLLAGPLGPAVTKSYNFADLGFSRGKEGKISRLASVWKVGDGSAEIEDAALATRHYRLAMKGRLDFSGLRFDGMTAAILDKRGCAVYSQKINGTLAHPKLGKLSMLESLAGPVLSVLGTVEKLLPGRECKVFYSGSVPQPGK